MMDKEKIFEEGYKKAVEVLHMNVTPKGFSATPERHANYFSIWARDHSITSLAAALTDDGVLIKTAVKGVLFLLEKQSNHGQIPSYVEIENKKKVYGGFGSITSVDSNMWVAISSAVLYRKTRDKRFLSDLNIVRYVKLYSLLKAMDSNDCGLIEVPLAGDWADIFSRSYHVLYDEVLYYQALKELLFLFEEKMKKMRKNNNGRVRKYQGVFESMPKRIRWIKKNLPIIKKKINKFFWLTENNIDEVFGEYMIVNEIDHKDYPYYQSHLMPFKLYWPHRFDSLGNILAVLFKISDNSRAQKIVDYALENKLNHPFPIKALSPPVFEHDKEWEPIYSSKEKPYHYHNGGIWPFIGGLWIHMLVKNNKKELASEELKKFSEVLGTQEWKFNEYMHGRTSQPLGRNFQAWSAAGYIMAYKSLKENTSIFY